MSESTLVKMLHSWKSHVAAHICNFGTYHICDQRTGFIQASMSKIQGLLKASPTVFKDLKLMKNPDLIIKILLP